MCGHRSSSAHARPSCQKTTTGTVPTLVRNRPACCSSESDPAVTRTRIPYGGPRRNVALAWNNPGLDAGSQPAAL